MEHKISERINEIWVKIKGIKHIKIIIGIIAVAIICLLGNSIASKLKSKTETIPSENTTSFQTTLTKGTEEEQRIEDILSSIEGIGKTRILITYDQEGDVRGVLVVAEGGNNPVAEWKIRHAVQTVLQIDYHSIDVYSMQ